ncbi:hypothetical protein SAMN02745206_03590 [Desulfacinum infernum DSM 9756]|jgi:hypothetical protein|uniref:Uncharacterized protein n=1 Tax=Desulfacinum infernum DSM 9756 TaxID=1121391 RepID=A0A1M5IG97_9BACT|nr:hypothetical protein SAMN02745206_03590 [Desulfacinum infernum DSM 9756]
MAQEQTRQSPLRSPEGRKARRGSVGGVESEEEESRQKNRK